VCAVQFWQAGGMKQAGGKQGRRTFTDDERADWVLRFRSSGLTQPEFAREHGLKLGTLQRWLYGRGAQAATQRKPLVPAPGDRSHRKPGRAPSATFREVRLPPLGPGSAGWVAEVTWPSGVTVRFGAGAEAAWIGAVLDVVRQAC